MRVPLMVLQVTPLARRLLGALLTSVLPSSVWRALYHYLTLNCLLSSLTLNCMLSSLLNLSHDIRAPLPRRSLLT